MEKYKKQIGASEAGGQFYEMKLVMLFLLRGTIAKYNGQIDSFRLAANLDQAHPFDDIVFMYTANGSTELILLQAKHKENLKKNTIVWDTLFKSNNKDFSIKKYLDGFMDMSLDEDDILKGPFARREFILYTNAPLKRDKKLNSLKTEANKFFKMEDQEIEKLCFDEMVYDTLKLNSNFSELVDELIVSIKSGHFKPEIPIFKKYRHILMTFVLGFHIEEEQFGNLFSLEFLEGTLPQDILSLRHAIFSKLADKDEPMTKLKTIKVELKKGYAGIKFTPTKTSLVEYFNKEEIIEFLDNFYLACNQPGEAHLENILKMEIASFYKISQSEAETIYNEVYVKVQNWWKKSEAYFLTEQHDWFERSRRNLSEPSLVYAVDLMKTKLKNIGIAYKNIGELEECFKSNKIINVVCNKATSILSCAQVYQMFEKHFSNCYCIFLEESSLHSMYYKILETFKDNSCFLAISSFESIPDTLIRIVNEEANKQNKRIVWIGAAQTGLCSISLKVGFKYLSEKIQDTILNFARINLQGELVPLVDLVNCTNFEETITDDLLVDLVTNKSVPIGRPLDGLGEMDSYYISRTLTWKDSPKLHKPDEIHPDKGNIFVLISAGPGMGKSTLVSSMMGEKFLWKYRINLREHSKLLKKQQNIDALMFLKEAINMSDLEYNFFKIAYEKNGRIILFFDGFDEIAPDYKNTVLQLFRSLRNSKVDEVWVTTRPGFEQELEMELNAAAFNLEPFSPTDQEDLLKRIWGVSDTQIVRDYLKEFSKSIKDSGFIGVPLHLKMISEMRNEAIFNDEMNLFSVYDHFFYNKFYEVAMKGKCKIDLNIPEVKEMVDEKYEIVWSKHEKLSLLALFEKSDILQVMNTEEINKIETMMKAELGEGKEKSGVVYSIIGDKPAFVHRTYAEFFAASWLKKWYMKHRRKKDFVKFNIYMNIFNDENIVLRTFFDFSLCGDSEACRAVLSRDLGKILKMSPSKLRKKDLAGRTAFHLVKAYNYDDILHILSEKHAKIYAADDIFQYSPKQYENHTVSLSYKTGRPHYAKYLSNEHNREIEEREIFTNNDVKIFESLHWACANGEVEKLKSFIECGADVNAKDNFNITPLHLAAAFGHTDIMILLMNHSGALLNEQDDNGSTPLHMAAMYSRVQAAEHLISNRAYLNMIDVNGYTPLHWISIYGHAGLAKFMIEHGADLNIECAVLYKAAENGHIDVVQIFLDHGANPKWMDEFDRTALHIAAQNGHNEAVLILTSHGADPNLKSTLGKTPLHLCAKYGHSVVVRTLIDQGADPSVASPNGMTPLHVAAKHGHDEVARILKSFGADPNAKDMSGWTPILFSAESGHSDLVRSLVGLGADPNVNSTHGESPLIMAVENGHLNVVETLIELGVDPNARNNRGWTPLHCAMNAEIVIFLINNGADPDTKSTENHSTALHMASERGQNHIAEILLRKGADPNVINHRLWTPLHFAALKGQSHIIQSLIQKGADPNTKNDVGWTPIMLAIAYESKHSISTLITLGADLNIKDKHGRTPLHFSVDIGNSDIANILIDHGADVNANDDYNSTPLHFAAVCGFTDILPRLIAAGSSVVSKNLNGSTPLHVAVENGRSGAANCMLVHGADANIEDDDGNTALHLAARYGKADIVELLLTFGAEINIQQMTKCTPLHLAAKNGHHNTVQQLLLKGATIDVAQATGCTALHLAAQQGHADVVELLLASGANVHSRQKANCTPLHLAAQNGHSDVAKRLIFAGADGDARDGQDRTPLERAARFRQYEFFILIGMLMAVVKVASQLSH